MTEASQYWGATYWGSGYWGSTYWGSCLNATPPCRVVFIPFFVAQEPCQLSGTYIVQNGSAPTNSRDYTVPNAVAPASNRTVKVPR